MVKDLRFYKLLCLYIILKRICYSFAEVCIDRLLLYMFSHLFLFPPTTPSFSRFSSTQFPHTRKPHCSNYRGIEKELLIHSQKEELLHKIALLTSVSTHAKFPKFLKTTCCWHEVSDTVHLCLVQAKRQNYYFDFNKIRCKLHENRNDASWNPLR